MCKEQGKFIDFEKLDCDLRDVFEIYAEFMFSYLTSLILDLLTIYNIEIQSG
jgi:hypothetical protein